jgi:hypothetical protein
MTQPTRHVVSVSLGSKTRDHAVEVELLGHCVLMERRGTDGNFRAAQTLFACLDGTVDALGMGGMDLYLTGPTERFRLETAWPLVKDVNRTPVVDGTGLKNTLEAQVIRQLARDPRFQLAGQPVLVVCAMDRFGMAQALVEAGAQITCGDLIFALKKDEPITDLGVLEERARRLLPELAKMPAGFLYPIGRNQEKPPDLSFRRYFDAAQIIAGDWHFIRGYMPPELDGKTIITNTVTSADVTALRKRGVTWLVTTTPNFGGRSFGTNLLEAALVAICPSPFAEIEPARDYPPLLAQLKLEPRIERLN